MQITFFDKDDAGDIQSIFSDKTGEEINDWLRIRSKTQVEWVLERWADSITWTQLSLLSDVYRVKMIERLRGEPSKMIPPLPRVWYVEPTEKAKTARETCQIGRGTKGNKRIHVVIDKPMMLHTNDGIHTAQKYGEGAKNPKYRGMLRELTEEEYLQKVQELKASPSKETKKGKGDK